MAHTLRLLIPLYALRRLSFDLAWLLTERLVSLEFAAALPGAVSDWARLFNRAAACWARSEAGIYHAVHILASVMCRCGAGPRP